MTHHFAIILVRKGCPVYILADKPNISDAKIYPAKLGSAYLRMALAVSMYVDSFRVSLCVDIALSENSVAVFLGLFSLLVLAI